MHFVMRIRADRRARGERGNKLAFKGSQQNYYVSRKGLGALTKTNPVPHLEFYYFGFQMDVCGLFRVHFGMCIKNAHLNVHLQK